jgi:hypothetical protein
LVLRTVVQVMKCLRFGISDRPQNEVKLEADKNHKDEGTVREILMAFAQHSDWPGTGQK